MAGTTKKLLRIGIRRESSGDHVDERLITSLGDITVGTAPSCTFVVKDASLPKSRKLFEQQADGTLALVFDKAFTGKVDVSGDNPQTLQELSRDKRTQKRGGTFVLPLTQAVRGRVAFGGLMILFQYVDPPVVLAAARPQAIRAGVLNQIDWPFAYIMAAAFILLGGTTTGLEVWWRQTGQYYYQPFQEGRQSRYELIRAEVKKAEEEKKEVPDKPPEDESEEPDDKAEAEAVAEAPPEPPPKPKPSAVRKAAQAKAARSAKPASRDRAKVAAATRQKTFLHVLGSKGGGPGGELDTLRGGAHQAALDSAFDAAGGVTTDRDGGSGAFASAGPSAVDGDGGGSGRYRGLTAEDTGGGRLATREVTTTQKAAREVTVKATVGGGTMSGQQGTGQIDRDAVTSVFSRRRSAIRSCYERALKENPNTKGKVTIRFTIGPAGRITEISVSENTTGNAGIGDCIIGRVRSWRFEPPSGGSVTFSYPFLLDAK